MRAVDAFDVERFLISALRVRQKLMMRLALTSLTCAPIILMMLVMSI